MADNKMVAVIILPPGVDANSVKVKLVGLDQFDGPDLKPAAASVAVQEGFHPAGRYQIVVHSGSNPRAIVVETISR